MSDQVRIEHVSNSTEIESLLSSHWHDDFIVIRGEVVKPAQLRALIAVADDDAVAGFLTWRRVDGWIDIVTLNALVPRRGIGRRLVDALCDEARACDCDTMRVITTNDNLAALAFWQKLGFRIIAVTPDAVTEARLLKPSIPLVAENGIAIRDEIELELTL